MRRHPSGHVLLSVLFSLPILGISVPAVLILSAACTGTSTQTAQLAKAMSLANSVHEFATTLPIVDPDNHFTRLAGETPPICSNLYGLSGWTFSPPIDSGGHPLTDCRGWEQRCTITSFDPARPAAAVAPTNTNARLVTVSVACQGRTIYTSSRVLAPTLGLQP